MNTNFLTIPNKIKVGFQERDDTYTKMLGYITYVDNKGKLRKQQSWERWRDKSILSEEYDNVPITGFVLNKNVGDYKTTWSFRKSYIRVYDPRGFEFEITVENLLYILETSVCIPGKGLEGEFIYSWDESELVLLPVNSPDYQDILEYNKSLNEKPLTYKDLKVGCTYATKKGENLLFLGKYDWYEEKNIHSEENKTIKQSIRYIFAYPKERRELYYKENGEIYFYAKAMSQSIVTKNIGRLVSEDIPEIFNKMVNEIEKSPFLSPIDYENIELADMTFDEFLDATRNMRKIFFYLDGNFCFVTNLMGKERGNILFAKHYEDIKMSKVFCYYDIYNWKTISAWKNYYELSLIEFENLQEFYDKMKPKKGRLYLKNGNFYEDFFTCESQNFYFS